MKTKVITTPKFIIKPEHNIVVCIMTVAKAKAFNISSKVWLCIAEKLADISSKSFKLRSEFCAKMQEFEFNRVTENYQYEIICRYR